MTDAIPPKKIGRPSKATADRVAAIADAIATGVPACHAATAAGVHRSTLAAWRSEFPDIDDILQKAESGAIAYHISVVKRAAADGVWQASAWWLERRFPGEFGRRLRTDQSVTDRGRDSYPRRDDAQGSRRRAAQVPGPSARWCALADVAEIVRIARKTKFRENLGVHKNLGVNLSGQIAQASNDRGPASGTHRQTFFAVLGRTLIR